MPAFSILPTAQGSSNAWTLIVGSSKWNAMRSSDGADTHIRSESTGLSDTYVMEDLPGEAAGIVGNPTHSIQAQDTFATGAISVVHVLTGFSLGTSTLLASYSLVTQAVTGATVALLNAAQAGLTSSGGGQPSRINASQVYVGGEYDVATSGFVMILCGIAGLIGAGVLLSEMPALARAASRVSPVGICKSLILPHEYAPALGAWRAYRHPRFVFLGRA